MLLMLQGVDSASNSSEYQRSSLEGKGPKSLSRPVMGYL
jgi:hypothetical protein